MEHRSGGNRRRIESVESTLSQEYTGRKRGIGKDIARDSIMKAAAAAKDLKTHGIETPMNSHPFSRNTPYPRHAQ